MCGIAGALVYRDATAGLFFEAVRKCRNRGEDSFGVVRWSPASGWMELRGFRSSVDPCSESFRDDSTPCFYLHTSRAEPTTEYTRIKTEADVPPFRTASVAVAHNGIIANDRQLARRFGIRPASRIDTAIMPELIRRIGFWRALREIRGGCAFGVVDADRRSLYLARNFLPLTIVWQPGIVVFASERRFFAHSDAPFPPYRIWDLPAYSAIEFSPAGYRDPVSWGDLPNSSSGDGWNSYPAF
jgi:7-cyano-7-deazaguanine synthase